MIFMNKKILGAVLAITLAMTAFGCDTKKVDANDVTLRNADMSEYVTLGQYKGLTVRTSAEITVSEADIDDAIADLMENCADKISVTDRAVQTGDKVVANLNVYVDGIAVENAGSTQTFTVGKGEITKEVDEAVVGMSIHETNNVDVTYEADYYISELAGKDAVIRINVVSIIPSKVTDEIVAKMGMYDCTTVDELRDYFKNNLSEELAEAEMDKAMKDLLSQVAETAEFKEIPEKYINDQLKRIDDSYAYQCSVYGISVDEYISFTYGMSKEELAEKFLHQRMIIEAIAQKEGFSMNDEVYYKKIDELAKAQGIDREAYFLFNNIKDDEANREQLTFNKVTLFLYDNANIIFE